MRCVKDSGSEKVPQARYRDALKRFDAATCEALAVGQATANRTALPAVGYSTHVFARICSHAVSTICAAPQSRWAHREFEHWDLSTIAAYSRSILEGYILFRYLADAPFDLEIQRTYVNVMHLYDCKKRISILPRMLSEGDLEWLKAQEFELINRLNGIEYFKSLDASVRAGILRGERLHIPSRHDLILAAGLKKDEFDFFYNYLSQYAHVFSFTFYRIEPDGRGTGLKNAFDQGALTMVLEFGAGIISAATDRMVEMFPDAGNERRGTDSKFSPGPAKNLPRHIKRERRKVLR